VLTVAILLSLVALGIAIAHAVGRAPLWPAVLVLSVLHLALALPLGR
jgi:hypothetical protein